MAGRSTLPALAAGVVLACLLVCGAPGYAEGALSCGQVVSSLTPCVSYLQKGGGPDAACCSGLRSLKNKAMTSTASDRQAACRCLKQAAASFGGGGRTNTQLAQGLPGKCGVNIPYNISPSTDCSKVK